jgi:hypothetical protein
MPLCFMFSSKWFKVFFLNWLKPKMSFMLWW